MSVHQYYSPRQNSISFMQVGWFILFIFLTACSEQEQPPARTITSIPPVHTRQVAEVIPNLETIEAARSVSAETPPAPLIKPTASTAIPLSPQIEQRIDDLLAQMTLSEKLGQMTLVEKNSISLADVRAFSIGAILSGGANGYPAENTAEEWVKMTTGFQDAALRTRLGIPILYGSDAVHGHNNLQGATIFPHNVGLGAARDADLVEEIGRLTALETAATGVSWNFAPVLAVPQDIRWGRTYEGYSEDTALVSTLGTAYLRGLQGADLADTTSTLGTPKHFIADGGTAYGSSESYDFLLDQGDAQIDEATLRTRHLPPYEQAIAAGARSIMVSFSSWNGVKMHARTDLLTWMLKDELNFTGFLVSDWAALDQISGDSYEKIVVGINAGIDMVMVPYEYEIFLELMEKAVQADDISEGRINDAVRRILRVKLELGLFEQPHPDAELLDAIGSAEAQSIARHAVRQSLVLLKNNEQTLPIGKNTRTIFIAGAAADDMSIQSGGWTINWQGGGDDVIEGTTIMEGIEERAGSKADIYYNEFGVFQRVKDAFGRPISADIGIAIVGERPYAEGVGDSADLALSSADIKLIKRMSSTSEKVIVILITGRPLIITNLLDEADAWVVAWLPGSEGAGVADVLFGDNTFHGKLPYSWPRTIDQLPFNFDNLAQTGCDAPLFPFGYGLNTSEETILMLPLCE